MHISSEIHRLLQWELRKDPEIHEPWFQVNISNLSFNSTTFTFQNICCSLSKISIVLAKSQSQQPNTQPQASLHVLLRKHRVECEKRLSPGFLKSFMKLRLCSQVIDNPLTALAETTKHWEPSLYGWAHHSLSVFSSWYIMQIVCRVSSHFLLLKRWVSIKGQKTVERKQPNNQDKQASHYGEYLHVQSICVFV